MLKLLETLNIKTITEYSLFHNKFHYFYQCMLTQNQHSLLNKGQLVVYI